MEEFLSSLLWPPEINPEDERWHRLPFEVQARWADLVNRRVEAELHLRRGTDISDYMVRLNRMWWEEVTKHREVLGEAPPQEDSSPEDLQEDNSPQDRQEDSSPEDRRTREESLAQRTEKARDVIRLHRQGRDKPEEGTSRKARGKRGGKKHKPGGGQTAQLFENEASRAAGRERAQSVCLKPKAPPVRPRDNGGRQAGGRQNVRPREQHPSDDNNTWRETQKDRKKEDQDDNKTRKRSAKRERAPHECVERNQNEGSGNAIHSSDSEDDKVDCKEKPKRDAGINRSPTKGAGFTRRPKPVAGIDRSPKRGDREQAAPPKKEDREKYHKKEDNRRGAGYRSPKKQDGKKEDHTRRGAASNRSPKKEDGKKDEGNEDHPQGYRRKITPTFDEVIKRLRGAACDKEKKAAFTTVPPRARASGPSASDSATPRARPAPPPTLLRGPSKARGD